MLNVAAKAGRLGPLALAVRDVALGAGIEHYTAGRSLRRLVGRGLLRRTAAGRGKFAATYQVEAGRNRTTVSPTSEGTQVHHSGGRNRTTPSHTGPAGVGPVWCGNVRSDCWRWKGLGLTKARTWAHLSDEPVSTSDLADALGVEARTARRHLAALAKYDLAGHVDAQGWVRGPADPDEVAEEIGTADATERQRKRHAEDRQDRAEALAAYAAVAEEPPSYVDPETGEVIPTTDLRTASPSPKDETDAAIARLLAAFPGAEVVTIHEEVAA